MRELWTSKLRDDLKNVSTFKAIASNGEEILSWIIKGWNYLSKDTIINGFVNLIKTNLSKYRRICVDLLYLKNNKTHCSYMTH